MASIESLGIKACRGVRECELPLNGKSVVLLGENGTGKSSIVDALEFFFTGKIQHLEGVQGLDTKMHGPHVAFEAKDLSVEVTIDPGKVRLSRSLAEGPQIPEKLKPYLDEAAGGRFVLRRGRLLDFIAEQPANKYKALADLIGLDRLEDCELSFMHARDKLKGEAEAMQAAIEKILQAATTKMGKTINLEQDLLPTLNEKLKGANLDPIMDLTAYKAYKENLLKQTKTANEAQALKFKKQIDFLEQLDITPETLQKSEEISKKIQDLIKVRERLEELSLINLLKAGQKVVADTAPKICPLCEQAVDYPSLLERIRHRLTRLQELSKTASQLQTAIEFLISTTDETAKGIAKVSKSLDYPKSDERKIELEKINKKLSEFIENARTVAKLETTLDVSILNEQKASLNKVKTAIQTELKSHLSRFEITEKDRLLLDTASLVDFVQETSTELRGKQKNLLLFQKAASFAETLYNKFSEVKKAKIKKIYEDISSDAQRFYGILHPGEKISNISLEIKNEKRASATIKMDFYNQAGVDPRSFASEGHLDSLGICLFLAFVKKFNKNCNLLVLDDVVTSIDAGHRIKICQLLLSEFSDRQLLITTHDELWAEELRSYQRTYGVDGKFKNLRIIRWSMEEGPVIALSKPRWEKIQEHVKNQSKQEAANQGRIYLEWILKEICLRTFAKVILKRNSDYMAADLLKPAKDRLVELAPERKLDIEVAFKHLEATAIMGNILSHNNPMADKVSINEVKEFCDAVRGIYNLFSCLNCGQLLDYLQQIHTIRCVNEKCVTLQSLQMHRKT
ncbi:MAG: AAA family ATPase [Firmicutes bacterium]|jgi:DNA repair exonuclease SbcCD ATPase subunit|nr:AAA family ATPase [Bacillota bacterium]